MDIRKLAAMGLSVLLAVAAFVPVPALATQNQAGAQYGDGEEPSSGANVTQLTLVAQDPDANLASNGGSAWVAERAKVQVPVAINFVVEGDGDILGPSSAAITNYSKFPVSVSNMKVTAANGASFAWQESGASAADQVYLEFRPSGAGTTAVNLSQFTGTSGAAPPVGEWDIAAASGASGTALELVGFDGRVGGFGSLDPLSREEFATIAWTIKAGSGKVALPATLAAATPADLKAAGDAIRGGDADVKAHYDELVGDTMTIHYGDQYATTATVRLVDVSTERGLTFMFTDALTELRMNYDSVSDAKWSTSRVKSYLNGGTDPDGGTSPLSGGFKLNVAEQAPTYPKPVTVSSLDRRGSSFSLDTVECAWWVPSIVEVYGAWPPATTAWPNTNQTKWGYTGNEGSVQFAYFANGSSALNTKLVAIGGENYWWWLRSNCMDTEFMVVLRGDDGRLGSPRYDRTAAIVPCFCL